jgi:hypothetical protein
MEIATWILCDRRKFVLKLISTAADDILAATVRRDGTFQLGDHQCISAAKDNQPKEFSRFSLTRHAFYFASQDKVPFVGHK